MFAWLWFARGEFHGDGDVEQVVREVAAIDIEADAENHEGTWSGVEGFREDAGGFASVEVDVVGPFDQGRERGIAGFYGVADGESGDAGEAWPKFHPCLGAQQDGEHEIDIFFGIPVLVASAPAVGLFFCEHHQAVRVASEAEFFDVVAGGGDGGEDLHIVSDGLAGECGGDAATG